jgi:hypothetical protein
MDAHRGASTTTITARLLEQSKQRKIWSRLLDWRDWVSYLYLPIIAVFLLVGPLLGLQFLHLHRSNSQKQALLEVIAEGSEDYRTVSGLLAHEAPSDFSDKYRLVEQFEPLDYEGFQLISETQVYDERENDRRANKSGTWRYYTHRRYRIVRLEGNHPLRLQFRIDGTNPGVRCANSILDPKFTRLKETSNQWSHWELSASLAQLPTGKPIDVIVETESFKPSLAEDRQQWTLAILPPAKIGIISMWVLLPARFYFAGFDLYERASPESQSIRRIEPTTGNPQSSGSLIAWSLVNPEPRHVYECHWVQVRAATLRDSMAPLTK